LVGLSDLSGGGCDLMCRHGRLVSKGSLPFSEEKGREVWGVCVNVEPGGEEGGEIAIRV